MNPGKWLRLALVFAAASLPVTAAAEEEAEASSEETAAEETAAESGSKSIDDRVADLEKAIEAIGGFQFSGMAYGSYQYNFNEPDSRRNTLRSFDPEHNNFTPDLAQIGIAKSVGEVTFGTKLDFGKSAVPLASDWNGDGVLDNAEETNDFELQEAHLTYAPAWGGGISVKAGKFPTLIGAELIEAPLNPNFTRSFSFGYAIPFTHTGVLFTVPVNDLLTVNAGVVNGWDNVVDNNDGKTFLGNLVITPAEDFSVLLNGAYGPEKTDTSDGARGVFDLVVNYAFDPFSLVLNFDYGAESDAALDGGDETWTSFAGIVGVNLKDVVDVPAGIYFRGEVFDDDGGARTTADQTLTSFTLTGKYFITDNLTFWLEFRTDGSSEDVFAEDGQVESIDVDTGETIFTPKLKDTQTTALVALSYVFN